MLLILFGFIIGAFVSLLGGGGAGLYLGVLTSQFGMATPVAVPTSLFISLPALFFGFLTQAKLKNVQFNLGNRMILASIPGVIIGTLIGKIIPTLLYDWIIGIIFIIMGIILAYKFFTKNKKQSNQEHSNYNDKNSTWIAIGLGLMAGLMAGIGGLSGGAATAAGLAILGIPAVKSAGTSTYVLSVMALVSLIAHLFTSTVAWGSGVNLMIGAVIGAVITPLALRRMNQAKLNKVLTPLLIIIMLYFGLKMII